MGGSQADNGIEEKKTKPTPKSIGLRSLIAFWILGLCNNYGYVVMLSAAHDILGDRFNDHDGASNDTVKNETVRDCNKMSTGAILLADIMPSLFIKITAPFFPLLIHFRMSIILVLSALGFILVGVAQVEWLAIVGVVCTSLSSGLGEASLLSYMAFYKNKNVITTWSSGTGAAGFVGAMSYLVLSKFLPLDVTVYLLVVVPVIMGLCFWLLLVHPDLKGNTEENTDGVGDTEGNPNDDVPLTTTQDSFKEKLLIVPSLLKYMIPLGLVYLFEYFINQGLFELIQFDIGWMSHGVQYKTYQVLYQIGVFISRSSINLLTIKKTWLLAVLQGLNVILFGTESVYSYIPSIYIAFLIVLWEGFLGGAAYVNTYHRINNEVVPEKREFSMAVTSLADALGISLAGFLALPTHNFICGLPKYN